MIPVTTLTLADTAATEALGKRLAAWLTPGKTVYLRGELGAGKTTLVRGLLRALGHQGAVKSPTYTLIEPYEFQNFSVIHCDFYRISDPAELMFLGLSDMLEQRPVLLIEWPEQAAGSPELPAADVIIDLAYTDTGRRCQIAADRRHQQALVAVINKSEARKNV